MFELSRSRAVHRTLLPLVTSFDDIGPTPQGLPLHIQIDTYEDYRDPNAPVSHRAYCQVKSFCDKVRHRVKLINT